MLKPHSLVLRRFITAALLTGTVLGSGAAFASCGTGWVCVIGHPQPSPEPPQPPQPPQPPPYVPPGGDGGGNNPGGGDGSPTPDPQQQLACQGIQGAMAVSQCDFQQAPGPRTVDGCGSGWSADLVPDAFVGQVSLGNLFTPNCNDHDTCYGTGGSAKESCDIVLGDEMRATCGAFFNPAIAVSEHGINVQLRAELARNRSDCNAQAQVYESVLINNVSNIPRAAYDAAQRVDACRNLHAQKEQNACQF